MAPAQASENLALSLSLAVSCSNQGYTPPHPNFKTDIMQQVKWFE